MREFSRRGLRLESLEPRYLLAANFVITEFMADNDDNVRLGEDQSVFPEESQYPFPEGKSYDWIEILNNGDEPADLMGYHLTDDADNLDQWTFPSRMVNPGEFLLVFASGGDVEDFYDAEGRLHADFALDNDGEYVGLISPEGEVMSEWGSDEADYPPQMSDVSYGFAQTSTLITPNSDVMYTVPFTGGVDSVWMNPDFDAAANGFTAGKGSLGFEDNPNSRINYTGLFETEIPSGSHAVYARYQFDVDDASAVNTLLLRMKFDNGAIVYLNGEKVITENAPDNPTFFSFADSRGRRDSQVIREFQEFDLAEHSDLLVDGKNTLAVHLMNYNSDTSDLLLIPELFADKPFESADIGYLITPTPGAANIVFNVGAGPVIMDLTENPGALADDQDLVVTAQLEEQNAPVDSVSLAYRVMFDNEIDLQMVDDGTGGDATAGDGIYSATIPHTASAPGEMIRWKVNAFDADGRHSRFPLFADPDDSVEYHGTIVDDSTIESNLNVLHWFAESPNSANSDVGTRASFFYLEEYYDNVQMDIHGQSSRSFPLRSYDLDFNRGNRLNYIEGERRVDDVNLLSTWADKGKFRNDLVYQIYEDTGNPYLHTETVRVEQNGEFFSIADLVEDSDGRTMERLGLNPDGALYKMYSDFNSVADATVFESTTSGAEKKNRKWEDTTELIDLFEATRLRGDDWTNFGYDNLDIPAFIDFEALQVITSNHDCCHKNYYFFRDSGRTNEWSGQIWDVDLSFGHQWVSGPAYFHDAMQYQDGLRTGANNTLISKFFQLPGVAEMYNRRMRTLMDEYVQPVGTPYEERYLETHLDETLARLDPNDDPFDPTPQGAARFGTVQGTDDADLFYNKWGSWDHNNGGRAFAARGETVREHIQRVKDDFADNRREFLYGQAAIPEPQIGNPTIDIGEVEFEPASGNPLEKYIQLVNNNGVAVDISQWKLQGAVEFTFKPGTVIPSGGTLYVSPDVNAFRARATGPSGGQGLFVQGGFSADGLTDGSSLALIGANGAAVGRTFVGELADPSDVQQFLRISELNYNPHDPNPVEGLNELELADGADAFEFIELINTGSSPLDISGVRLWNGVEFTVPGGSSLEPGERALAVKDRGAFESRYGSDFNILGQYSGTLGNTGDGIFIDDADAQPVQDLGYGVAGEWPARPNGGGSSLELINLSAPAQDPSNWQASPQFGGTPGQPPQPYVAPIVINEVLAHSAQPEGDRIELFNTFFTDVDLSGWYLTNSSDDYFKFEIPAGTIMAAREYLVLDQSEFGFDLRDWTDEQLFLLEANPDGIPVRFVAEARFGITAEGVSQGPWPNADSPFQPLAEHTFGEENAEFGTGDVVISEIQYNPIDPDGPGSQRSTNYKYIELYNRTDSPIDMTGWELAGTVDYDFPDGTTIGAGETVIMVPYSERSTSTQAVFDFTYNTPVGTQFIKQVRDMRNLTVEAGALRLERPGEPSQGAPNDIPTLIVDEVVFDVVSPWPHIEDGTNRTLTRISPSAYGNSAASWIIASPSLGVVSETDRIVGDSNDDGQFNQEDIVLVLQADKYMTGEPAGWFEGDWTMDGVFDQRDVIEALQAGNYVSEPLASMAALSKARDRVFEEIDDPLTL